MPQNQPNLFKLANLNLSAALPCLYHRDPNKGWALCPAQAPFCLLTDTGTLPRGPAWQAMPLVPRRTVNNFKLFFQWPLPPHMVTQSPL